MQSESLKPWGHIDLFCGPGGFATGFEWAGFTALVGLDIHEPSVSTYRRNHPGAASIRDDIRNVDSRRIRELIGGEAVHVISAGVPCEGFSMSNRNRGKFVDERNFLFVEFLRVAEDFRPPYIVLENVSGMASHSKGFFRKEILGGMRSLGYRAHHRLLDALNYGVAQRRRRLLFVGTLPGWKFEWPTPSHGHEPGLRPPVTVWDAIGDLPSLENDEEVATYHESSPLSSYARYLRDGTSELTNHRSPKHPMATIRRIGRTRPGEPMYASFRQRVRLDPDRPSPTLVSGGIRPQFHYGHPTQPRGLSIRERARIQSFPDRYYFEGGIVQGRVQTGDAVPPLLARAIACEIARGLQRGYCEDLASQPTAAFVSEIPAPPSAP